MQSSDISNSDIRDASGPGIDEAMIRTLVNAFYDRVKQDALIGPVFAERISDWEPHLQRMYAFWSSVMLGTRRYSGRPVPLHATLDIEGRHFDRWLTLFVHTAREVCPPQAAAAFVFRARKIAEGMQRAIDFGRT